jgi:hypothetical protein
VQPTAQLPGFATKYRSWDFDQAKTPLPQLKRHNPQFVHFDSSIVGCQTKSDLPTPCHCFSAIAVTSVRVFSVPYFDD